MPVFLNIRNPKRGVEKLEHLKAIGIYNEEKSKRDGFDGIEGHDVKDILRSSNGTEYVVFKANQIKSATDNIGPFDGSNPDIRYRRVDTRITNWDSVSEEQKEILSKKGWTEEKYNSVSQEERDQALRCLHY